jgi:hypothetical protein
MPADTAVRLNAAAMYPLRSSTLRCTLLLYSVLVLTATGCITIQRPTGPGCEVSTSSGALLEIEAVEARLQTLRQESADALARTAMRIASDVQAWMRKPASLGGPSAGQDLSDANFAELGYYARRGVYSSLTGRFQLDGSSRGSLVIDGCTGQDLGTAIEVTVTGPTPDDIAMVVAPGTCAF